MQPGFFAQGYLSPMDSNISEAWKEYLGKAARPEIHSYCRSVRVAFSLSRELTL